MDLMMAEANKLDVDVLCWGGTHRFDAYEYENKFFVNPGSATGAFTNGWVAEGEEEETVPSFCLMDVSLLNFPLLVRSLVLWRGSNVLWLHWMRGGLYRSMVYILIPS
jgi:vacuolar protein sorting-associated protein 29